ncbi:MAG: hypothetical protein M3R63_03045 [Actinomycetota bacterium]|nr:hypothetical protein [Actinomycetota bacterium]
MDGANGEGHPELPSIERWLQIWAQRELLIKVARRRGAQDPEDVAQEAMLRAAQHPEIPSDKLRPWLIVVTGRLCVDGHRRRVKEADSWARTVGRVNAQRPGQYPEDDVCERAVAGWAAAVAADALPARQIRALRLTAAGYDVRQVATELGVPYRAAESLLARARRTLRAALSTGLGVLGWMCRAPVHAVGSPVQVGLAAATAAVLVVPLGLPAHHQPLTPPMPPAVTGPVTPAEPTAERSSSPRTPSAPTPVPVPVPVPPSSPSDVPEEAAPSRTYGQGSLPSRGVGSRPETRSVAPAHEPSPAAPVSPRAAPSPKNAEAPTDPSRGADRADHRPPEDREQSTDRGQDHDQPPGLPDGNGAQEDAGEQAGRGP